LNKIQFLKKIDRKKKGAIKIEKDYMLSLAFGVARSTTTVEPPNS
jgi:hypothetical protein